MRFQHLVEGGDLGQKHSQSIGNRMRARLYDTAAATPLAAVAISDATACGCDT